MQLSGFFIVITTSKHINIQIDRLPKLSASTFVAAHETFSDIEGAFVSKSPQNKL